MGCLLYQLPPSYKYTKARLASIIRQLEPHRRNVVEFRHASWWNETVFDAFTAANIIFCSTSSPRLPDDLIKTAKEIYIRFHGLTKWYQHCYTKTELIDWQTKILAANPARAWIYFNNDRNAYAIKNAKTLKRLLKD